MRTLLKLILLALIVLACSGSSKIESKNEQTTTYYLIRHAEKNRDDKTDKDPNLNDKGLKRANNWAKTFENITFDNVYSTNYNRTKETALPTAKSNGLELQIYDPRTINISEFTDKTKGKTILIVGHSNTTPSLANKLLDEKKYEIIDDTNNANLYIVTIVGDKKVSTLLHIN